MSPKLNGMPVQKSSVTERLRPEVRSIVIYVGIFSLFINVLMLTSPIYMLQIYDRVLASGSVPTLLYLTIAVVGLILAGGFLENIRSRIMIRLGKGLDDELSEILFSGMFDRQVSENLRHSTRPLQDFATIRNFLSGPGLTNIFDAPWIPIYLCVVFLFSPILGLIATFGAITLFVLALLSDLATRKQFTDASAGTGRAQRFADLVARNAETVEAMGLADGLRLRWKLVHSQGLAHHSWATERAGVISSLAKVIRPSLQISILGTGAYLALQQIITPGVMIASSIIMSRALAPIEGAIGNWRAIVLARDAYGRLRDHLSTIDENKTGIQLPKPDGNLSVERLVAPVPGGTAPILKGFSFSINKGELLGVIGPSGSGKSTLARLLIGFWKPSSGNVRLDGADVADWLHMDLGPHIGYLPQEVNLFDGTIAENIGRFGELNSQEMIEAATRAGVHELILKLPEGYETKVGESGAILSGGQKQRIGLARALYGNPSLVVMDEPNSNLDGVGEHALLNALIDLKTRAITTVVIAHRPSVVSTVDKLLVLKEGMIEHFGPTSEVMPKVTGVSGAKPVAGKV